MFEILYYTSVTLVSLTGLYYIYRWIEWGVRTGLIPPYPSVSRNASMHERSPLSSEGCDVQQDNNMKGLQKNRLGFDGKALQDLEARLLGKDYILDAYPPHIADIILRRNKFE